MATKKKAASKSDMLVTAAETVGSTLGAIVNVVRSATGPTKKTPAKKAAPVKATKKTPAKKVVAKKKVATKAKAKRKP